MAYSYQRATSDGTMVSLDISIDYLDRDEITVYFDDVLTSAWSWSGTEDKRILFSPAVPNGVVVMVKRTTDASELRHYFSQGAQFTAPNLDEDLRQALHMAQEASEANLVGDFFTDINMHGFRVYNIGTAVNDADALTLGQYKDDALGAYQAKLDAEAAAALAASFGSDFASTDVNKGAAGIGHGAPALLSIAELRTLRKDVVAKSAFVLGYYAAHDGGGGEYILDAADLVSADNGGTIIVANDGGRWKLQFKTHISTPQFGCKGDGTTDDTAALLKLFDWAPDGTVIDFAGRRHIVYVGVPGTPTGDALPLASVLRLSGKSRMRLRNGYIIAANPGASGPKLRYPTTLTLDGCMDCRLDGLFLASKGENYGWSDDSGALGPEGRRSFLAQNGGHALAIIRSSRIHLSNCEFLLCGSVAPLYVSSSDRITAFDCYSSAESLGYGAYCADSWCGNSGVSGYPRHELVLNNCRTDNNGATYGSKAGVVAEDADVVVRVNGGVWKDSYANGSAHFLGAAFSSNCAQVFVNGGTVDNCASIGLTTNSTATSSRLHVNGVTATNLRTSMHIQDATSFGDNVVTYLDCRADIAGTSLWAEDEFSVSSVVANRKVTTELRIDIVNCVTTGADTFAINSARASYGGIRVVGGHHTVVNRIFDSTGWGGSASGTGRGYELLGGAVFRVTTSSPSAAKTQATTAINAIKNQDGVGTFTQQLVDFDRSVRVEAVNFHEFVSVSGLGAGLVERRLLAQQLIGCYQAARTAGEAVATQAKVVSLDALTGSAARVTFALRHNKVGNAGTLIDDVFLPRRVQSVAAGPAAVAGELQITYLLNKNAFDLSVGAEYPIHFSA